jgi:hypothetical protein
MFGIKRVADDMAVGDSLPDLGITVDAARGIVLHPSKTPFTPV